MKYAVLGLAIVTLLFPQTSHAAVPAPAAHKAIYKISMISTRSSSVINVSGQMYYDFADTCDAWSSDQKFTLNYIYADEPEAKYDSQYTSRETKAGDRYDFATKRLRNGEIEEQYVGYATRNADGTGLATYSQPESKTIDLPQGFFFPTQHTFKVIEQAMNAAHVFDAHMFDGSDGEGALEVNAVMGGPVTNDVTGKLASNSLLASPSHKIRMAFYPPMQKGETQEEAEPDYEMTAVMHENGVVSSLEIDYQDFSIKGELEAIESLPAPKC